MPKSFLLLSLALLASARVELIAGPGNYNRQGPLLVGIGITGDGSGQGTNVAISGDGNTAAVGSYTTGDVWFFVRSNGVWVQQGNKITIEVNLVNDLKVALSFDGNTAVIGSFVFSRSGGVWTQQAQLAFGYSAAISADGNTVVVGEYKAGGSGGLGPDCPDASEESRQGQITVFTRSGVTWTKAWSVFGDLGVGDCPFADGLGSRVFVSEHGDTILAASLFTHRAKVFFKQAQQAVVPGDPFGLTSDGNTLVTDGLILHRDNGLWSQTGTFPLFNNGGVPFAFSGDGSTLVFETGAPDTANIRALVRSGPNFAVQHEYDNAATLACLLYNANSAPLAVSANGDTLIVGTPCANAAAGGAQVFASPQLATTLTHSGDFHRGQTGAQYIITVQNAGDRDTHSPINLVDRLPAGLVATAIAGSGWTCTLATVSCTRSDGLAVSATYPAITVTVNVAIDAPATLTNTATASGGGSTWGNAHDPTTITP